MDPPIGGVICKQCGRANPGGAANCLACGSALPVDDVTGMGTTIDAPSRSGSTMPLESGTVVGDRYELLEMLGRGGMGAVYKARDRELDRTVALKLIRSELLEDARALQRFKQELILSRQISHQNVIQIFDLGAVQGHYFISMAFIAGGDLAGAMKAGRFPLERTIRIMRQACRAVEAAHAENIVHRDLKPRNIMLTEADRVVVMDFGVASSLDTHGLTQTGALIGTPAYMSPEQAKGTAADARSDLFSLGVIFYELLTGKLPFEADTTYGSLMKRILERARPVSEIDSSIPPQVASVVAKCLETDPAQRYQTASELAAAVDALAGEGGPPGVVSDQARPRRRVWQLVVAAMICVLAAGAVFLQLNRKGKEAPATRTPVSLLIADFDNQTGDAVFDGALEPMLAISLEGAPFITSYNRTGARRSAQQLRPGSTRLDEAGARLVAVREGINIVVSGSLVRLSGKYSVSLKAIDAVSGKPIVSAETQASNRERVLGIMAKLAVPIRTALGDTTPESAQLAAAETFTAASVEAAHAYAVAQDLQYAGKREEAVQAYLKTVELDPELARAYAGLAVTYLNMGQRDKADRYFAMALTRINRITDREKYRTRGLYFVMTRDFQHAIGEFESLVRQYPADTAGEGNLGVVYLDLRNLPKAIEYGRHAVEMYPSNVPYLNNVALFLMYSGDFEAAERQAREVLGLNSSFRKAHIVIALCELAQGNTAKAAESYQNLAKLGPAGASSASGGMADLLLYEGRTSEAIQLLQTEIERDRSAGLTSSAANKLTTLGYAQLIAGHAPAAIQAAGQALKLSKDEDVELDAARIFVEAGQGAQALAVARGFASRLESAVQAYSKLIEGKALVSKRPADAIALLAEANRLADTWLGHFELGRAYLEAKRFTEARGEFELCWKRRGEATAVFLDEVPSFRLAPPVQYYIGRALEGQKAASAAEAYRRFLEIKKNAEPDAIVADARRRLRLR